MTDIVDVSTLNECFICNSEAGSLTWKHRPRHHFATDRACNTWNSCFAGRQAGGRKDNLGYFQVSINDHRVYLHRVVWAMSKGTWPGTFLDHIDGNPSNNSLVNLREATNQQNSHNRKKNRNNTSGYIGVRWSPRQKKWSAAIRVNWKLLHLGYFDSIDDAHNAYLTHKRTHHAFYNKDRMGLR